MVNRKSQSHQRRSLNPANWRLSKKRATISASVVHPHKDKIIEVNIDLVSHYPEKFKIILDLDNISPDDLL